MKALDRLLDLIFPPVCLSCSHPVGHGAALCAKCDSCLELNDTFFCGRCSARVPDDKKICHRELPYLLAAALDYRTKPAADLVKALKFRRAKVAAEYLSDKMIISASKLPVDFENFIVTPVPLGKKRSFERGFNQAELLAEPLARGLGISMDASLLSRVRETKAQSGIRGHAERETNMASAFLASNSAEGQNILLVDDVKTSGATLLAAASALKAAGAKKVIAMVAAKA